MKLPIGGIWGVFVSPPKPDTVREKESYSYSVSGAEGEDGMTVDSKSAGKGFILGGYYRFSELTANTPSITVTLDKAPQGITAASAGSLRFVGPFPTQPEKMLFIQGATGQTPLSVLH
ncbi:MAG: hypothetical protein EOP06_24510 [Proteobacteria bacterium]|nr:MAG: hypothetical protein EOP06_24510 [Pseudomonadota bacterium]